MKYILVLLLFVTTLGLSQSVRTENTGNRYVHYNSAATDTIRYWDSTVTVNAYQNIKYLVSLTVNRAVASDSIFLYNGTGVVAAIVLGASPPAYPFTVPYNVRLNDSLFTIVQKKTSDITVVYRRSY